MRFRQGVYGNRHLLTPMAQVLLLRLSDDMSANGNVSVPRSQLAEEFNTAPPRITEWIKQARAAGFLDIVRRGRPGVTAVYAGKYVPPGLVREGVPSEVREGVPSTWYAQPDQVGVREGVPQSGPAWYAQPPTQEVVQTAALGATPTDHVERRGFDEESGDTNVAALAERRA